MSKKKVVDVPIERMKHNGTEQTYTYPCTCGAQFIANLADLHDGSDSATCPSCASKVKVLFDESKLPLLRIDATDSEDC